MALTPPLDCLLLKLSLLAWSRLWSCSSVHLQANMVFKTPPPCTTTPQPQYAQYHDSTDPFLGLPPPHTFPIGLESTLILFQCPSPSQHGLQTLLHWLGVFISRLKRKEDIKTSISLNYHSRFFSLGKILRKYWTDILLEGNGLGIKRLDNRAAWLKFSYTLYNYETSVLGKRHLWFLDKLDICLWNTDAPGRNNVKIWQNL